MHADPRCSTPRGASANYVAWTMIASWPPGNRRRASMCKCSTALRLPGSPPRRGWQAPASAPCSAQALGVNSSLKNCLEYRHDSLDSIMQPTSLEITPAEARSLENSGEPLFFIDVREPHEWDVARI